MKKFKIKSNKALVLTIGLLLALSLSLVFSANGIAVRAAEAESGLPMAEAREYWRGDISEEFDPSSVLVVMDKRVGGINKRHENSFFGDFAKEAVYDLTYINGDARSHRQIDTDNFSQILQIKLPETSKENVVSVIRQLEQVDGILWAGPNHYDRPAAQPANAGGIRYPSLWGMHGSFGIQAEQAWDITTGANTVRVGVIDTGLDAHPDLNGNIVAEGGDFVNMANVNQNIPGALRPDPTGHGTRVSGVLGSTGTNPNGVVGVAWNVQLIPLQVSFWDTNSVTPAWRFNVAAVTRAITWATNNNVDILNYSGGGTDNNAARRNAIGNFQGLFVCSAGNNDRNNENNSGGNSLHYPSDYSRNQIFSNRVISVGAIKSDGTRPTAADWGFDGSGNPQGSNYGATSVSLFAPGDGILTIGTTYVSRVGTSYAAPVV